jgi:hypothetical protein
LGDIRGDILSRSLEDIGREYHLYLTAKFGSTAFALKKKLNSMV